ncbi:Fic family protein [Emticicia soli]|uniref:Fic family protein n=1 Tax=Emticicia soli TaxID=2027878 RepID=A0ABW5J4S3_9BACT
MQEAAFRHYPLELLNPSFESPLVDLVTELELLRKKRLTGSTNPYIFFQLKSLFHILESIGSARIEGNNTTIAEYVETKLEDRQDDTPSHILEIQNLELAMDFIEETIDDTPINKAFLSELHKMIVFNLPVTGTAEGDRTPGEYRKANIKISKSLHLPPDYTKVDEYMDELLAFINTDHPPKYALLKAAIAHHRFVWIHPFGNGNGRTVRLFTYAMLIKLGFNVRNGRLLNPTAVFCNNRDNYYRHLAEADQGTPEGLEKWCLYVLTGLKEEIEKIDRLLDYDFLKTNILLPTVSISLERQLITDTEAKILRRAIEKQVIQAGDLKDIFAGKHGSEISRQISRLVEKKMLRPHRKQARKYLVSFDNSYLLRGIVKTLNDNGFWADNEKNL